MQYTTSILKGRVFAALLTLSILCVFSTEGSISSAKAQVRRGYLEEFTGSWCGFCVRGNFAIQEVERRFPGRVAVVCFHSGDPMRTNQGDSLINGKVVAQSVSSFPLSWLERSLWGDTKWAADPSTWTHLAGFGGSASDPQYVDTMLNTKALATVGVSNVTFSPTTHEVSATITTTFHEAMSGDFRMNLLVTEDSVSGPAGTRYDQTNYYSKTDKPIGGNLPNNPFYNSPYKIDGWQHRYVFLTAPAGIRGKAGVIPSTVAPDAQYSQTFTFVLPDSTLDPNNIRLVGIAYEYSATDSSMNQVFDAEVAHLSAAKIPVIGADAFGFPTDGNYITVKSNQQTSETITFQNNDNTAPLTLGLSLDTSNGMPKGWSAAISPSTITIGPGTTTDAKVTITAPDQSGCAAMYIIAIPQRAGAYAHHFEVFLAALSDNTQYGYYYTPGFALTPSIEHAFPNKFASRAAAIPLIGDAILAWPIEKMNFAIFDNDPSMGGVFQTPANTVNAIQNLLNAGKPVFYVSEYAMSAQYDTNNPNHLYASTDDARSFFEDTLGIKYRFTEYRADTNTGKFSNFNVQGTSDPIGSGINATLFGGQYSAPFSITPGSNSSPIFYYDSNTSRVAGIRYTHPQSGGRMVYLGFNLNAFTDQKLAATIAARSIDWLLGSQQGVATSEAPKSAQLTASENPFYGTTDLYYPGAPDEREVSFTAFDVLGRQVATLVAHQLGDGSWSAFFNASELPDGMYTVVARSAKGTHEIRIIKK